MAKTAKDERREFLLDWARDTDTPEAWQKYLDEYPTGNSKAQREAKRRLNMAKNKNAVEFGPIKMEQVNLAEDPDYEDQLSKMRGLLDDWIIDTDDKGQYPRSAAALQEVIDRMPPDWLKSPEYIQ